MTSNDLGNKNMSSQNLKCKINMSLNYQYKDVHKKTTENQHCECILKANYFFKVHNVHFKLASSTEYKKRSYLIDPDLSFNDKI